MNIDLNNYEEWMIDYIEDNLSPEEEILFAGFMERHPELRSDFELFKNTKLTPDMDVVFENKQSLKKKEKEAAKVVAMGSWVKYSAAIAALLILFIGIRFFISGPSATNPANAYKNNNSSMPYAFERPTEKINSKSTIKSRTNTSGNNVLYAQVTDKNNEKQKPSTVNSGDHKINEILHVTKENVATDKIEFAQMQPIKNNRTSSPELKSSDLLINIDALYNQEYRSYASNQNARNINFNKDNSVVDFYNNAYAVANTVGDALGFGPKKQRTDINQQNSSYKTTDLKFFNISYYNRKKAGN